VPRQSVHRTRVQRDPGLEGEGPCDDKMGSKNQTVTSCCNNAVVKKESSDKDLRVNESDVMTYRRRSEAHREPPPRGPRAMRPHGNSVHNRRFCQTEVY